jgi:hypothetical protein
MKTVDIFFGTAHFVSFLMYVIFYRKRLTGALGLSFVYIAVVSAIIRFICFYLQEYVYSNYVGFTSKQLESIFSDHFFFVYTSALFFCIWFCFNSFKTELKFHRYFFTSLKSYCD